MSEFTFPKLHNAAWPGVVGKEPDSDQPPIDLDTMLDLTATAEVDGVKFDGVDLFLFDPHISIDITDDELKEWADKFRARNLVVGTVVAPIWDPTGGGSAMDEGEGRTKFLTQVRKGCRIANILKELGVRPYGNVRFDSACGVEEWLRDPDGNQEKIAETFRQACDIAADVGETMVAEGEICWGGLHSWKYANELLEMVDRPNIGFQADMAHLLQFALGYNAEGHRVLPEDYDWAEPSVLDKALEQIAKALRPKTKDFHVAQNDATVHGSGSHGKTGRHCPAKDPNGKLDIAKHASYWLRGDDGKPTKKCRHVCWDGCMFSNEIMMDGQTWQDILEVMVGVRDAHGWNE